MSYSYSYLKAAHLRAFIQHVSQLPPGNFVDIGPVHPGGQSITSPLHELGWKGVNIEPIKSYSQYLNKVRRSDIVLQGVISNNPVPLFIEDSGPLGCSLGTQASSSADAAAVSAIPSWTLMQILEQNNLASVEVLHIDGRAIFDWPSFTIDFTRVQPWLILMENFSPSAELQSDLNRRYQTISINSYQQVFIAHHLTALKEAVVQLKGAEIPHLAHSAQNHFSMTNWLLQKLKARIRSSRWFSIAKDIQTVVQEKRVLETSLRVAKRKAKSTAIGKRLQRFKNRNSHLPADYFDELPASQTHSQASLMLLQQLKTMQAKISQNKVQ